MKILLSIHQKHWDNIKSGNKTIEIRKTSPKNIEYPFHVICYVTGGVGVVGEFVCDCTIRTNLLLPILERSCLTSKELNDYADGGFVRGWCVKKDSVVIHEKPIPLSCFGIKRAPQSWQYLRQLN